MPYTEKSPQPFDDLEVNVPQVLDHLRLQGEAVRTEFVTQCIFHQETGNPNLEINTNTGLWHCWVCGEKGNLPKLVMRVQGVSYRDAVETIQDFSSMPDIAAVRNRNLAQLSTILTPVRHRFEEVDIEQYRSGRSWWWTNDIPYGRFDRATVRRYRLGYDGATARAVIPVRADGKWVAVIKRATRESQQPRYRYTTGFDRRYVLYGLDDLRDSWTSVVLVEGAKDALRARSYGIENCIATLGTGISHEQIGLLEERFDEVTIFGDNDAPGHLSTFKVANLLADCVPRVFVVQWRGSKKDPNELSGKAMRRLLDNRVHWTSLLEPDYDAG